MILLLTFLRLWTSAWLIVELAINALLVTSSGPLHSISLIRVGEKLVNFVTYKGLTLVSPNGFWVNESSALYESAKNTAIFSRYTSTFWYHIPKLSIERSYILVKWEGLIYFCGRAMTWHPMAYISHPYDRSSTAPRPFRFPSRPFLG